MGTDFPLDSKMPLADQIRELALAGIDEAASLLGSHEGDPDVAVHETRKILKRLRALLGLLKGPLRGKQRKQADRDLRDAGRLLSDFRDARVRLDLIDALRTRDEAKALDRFLQNVSDELQADYDEVFADGALGRAVEEASNLLRGVRRQVRRWKLTGCDDPAAFRAGIERTYTRGSQGMARVLVHPTDETFHEWRKRVKELRHHFEHAGPVDPAKWPETPAGTLKDLARSLGGHHDLAVLGETLVALVGPDEDIGALRILHDQIRDERLAHEARCLEIGRAVFAERPEAFLDRITNG